MGQMTTILIERPQGSLPSTLEVNIRREGIEHYKAIALRSGKELEGLSKANGEDMEASQSSRLEVTQKQAKKGKESKSKALTYNPLPDITEVPFPQRL